jgi:hypothetical protein
MRNSRRIFIIIPCLLLTCCVALPREAKGKPQDSQIQLNQSVVEAARRAREMKRTATTPAKVITNDDLDDVRPDRGHEDFNTGIPTAPRTDSSNVSELTAGKTLYPAAVLTSSASLSNSQESEEAAAEDAEIAKLKGLLHSAENDLHWQERDFLLLQNTVYSNPAYTTTQVGNSQLDSAQLRIEETQQEIESLKGPLADLEWRHWRRIQAQLSENGSAAEELDSPPPSALVLPQP